MAKYRHRTFEMFDFLDEATRALASKSTRANEDLEDPESLTFRHLSVSRPRKVVHVKFKTGKDTETLSELQKDLSKLADFLVNDSSVLFDFEDLPEFGVAAIDDLALFQRKLQSKGSRIVLCNLDPAVRASFFPNRTGNQRSSSGA